MQHRLSWVRRVILQAAAVLLFAACASQPTFAPVKLANGITVRDAWVAASGSGQASSVVLVPTGAAYFTLDNGSTSPVRLLRASSEIAAKTELHETRKLNDMMVMLEARDGMLIPPGGSVSLQAGGSHVMFVELKQNLQAGSSVKLTLTFENSLTTTLDVPVRAR